MESVSLLSAQAHLQLRVTQKIRKYDEIACLLEKMSEAKEKRKEIFLCSILLIKEDISMDVLCITNSTVSSFYLCPHWPLFFLFWKTVFM